MLSFLLVSFFVLFFFALDISNPDQALASVVLPTIPSHFLCFVSLCRVPRSIYIFGIECHSTLQEQEELISRLPVEIYV